MTTNTQNLRQRFFDKLNGAESSFQFITANGAHPDTVQWLRDDLQIARNARLHGLKNPAMFAQIPG